MTVLYLKITHIIQLIFVQYDFLKKNVVPLTAIAQYRCSNRRRFVFTGVVDMISHRKKLLKLLYSVKLL